MNRSSKLAIATTAATLAILGGAAVYAQDAERAAELRSERSYLHGTGTNTREDGGRGRRPSL